MGSESFSVTINELKPKWVKYKLTNESIKELIKFYKNNYWNMGWFDKKQSKSYRDRHDISLESLCAWLLEIANFSDILVEIKDEPTQYRINSTETVTRTQRTIRLKRPGMNVIINHPNWGNMWVKVREQTNNGSFRCLRQGSIDNLEIRELITFLRRATPKKRLTIDNLPEPRKFLGKWVTFRDHDVWFRCNTTMTAITSVRVATIKDNLKVLTEITAEDKNAWFLIEGFGDRSICIIVDADVTKFYQLTKSMCIDVTSEGLNISEGDADFIRHAIIETLRGKNDGSETA